MRYLDLAVRRLIESSALALGALVVVAAVWLGLWTMSSPGCSVDPDHGDAVLAGRVLAGAWIVLELLLGAVLGSSFLRSPDDGWRRVAIALLLPAGAVALWIGFSGVFDAVIDELGATGAGSCW